MELQDEQKETAEELLTQASFVETDFYNNCCVMTRDLLRSLKPKPITQFNRLFHSPVSHPQADLLKDVAHMTETVTLMNEMLSDKTKATDQNWLNRFDANKQKINAHLKTDMPSKIRLLWSGLLMTAGIVVAFASTIFGIGFSAVTLGIGSVAGIGITVAGVALGSSIFFRGVSMFDEGKFHARDQKDLLGKANVVRRQISP